MKRIIVCEKCGGIVRVIEGTITDGTYCKCPPLEVETAMPPAVRWSEWVEELEAALRRLIELQDGTSECWGYDEEWTFVRNALQHALDRERSRPNDQALRLRGEKEGS